MHFKKKWFIKQKCSWSGAFVITSIEIRLTTAAQGTNSEKRDNSPTNATFDITDCKLYVPEVTLSAENDNKFLEKLKTGFERTIEWNKYRLEMPNQARNNNLNYLIDPTFTNVNRLFFLSFENERDRYSFSNIMYQKLK